MEVRCDDAAAVIDVDDVSREEEVVDERHHSTICRAYRLADGATEVYAEVARGNRAIEGPTRAELAGDDRSSRLEKRRRPHWRPVVGATPDLSCSRILAVNACQRRGIERPCKIAVHGEGLRHWRWYLRKSEPNASDLGSARLALQDRVGDQAALVVNGHATEPVPDAGRRLHEVQRLAGQRPAYRNDLVNARGRIECQTYYRAGLGRCRTRREPHALRENCIREYGTKCD